MEKGKKKRLKRVQQKNYVHICKTNNLYIIICYLQNYLLYVSENYNSFVYALAYKLMSKLSRFFSFIQDWLKKNKINYCNYIAFNIRINNLINLIFAIVAIHMI